MRPSWLGYAALHHHTSFHITWLVVMVYVFTLLLLICHLPSPYNECTFDPYAPGHTTHVNIIEQLNYECSDESGSPSLVPKDCSTSGYKTTSSTEVRSPGTPSEAEFLEQFASTDHFEWYRHIGAEYIG